MNGLHITLVSKKRHLICVIVNEVSFMFYALNFQNQLIHASSADISKEYYCPVCHQLVKLRTGRQNSNYFAHEHTIFSKQHHETKIHQVGKKLLMRWGSALGYVVRSEVYFKKIKRRADVILNLSKRQIVIEYQCSPISAVELSKRSHAYVQNGLHCIWLVGKRYCLHGRISQQNAQFFRYHPNIGFYFIYLNAEMQRLELYYQIQQAAFLRPKYRIKFLKDLKELIQFIRCAKENYLEKLSAKMMMRQVQKLNRIETYSKGMTRTLQVQCYLNQLVFHQEILKSLSPSFSYPIYRYSKAYFQVATRVGIDSKKMVYQMPFINYHNFI